VADAAHDLERLRALRARPEPDPSIGHLVSATASDAKRTQQRLGAFIDLWEVALPAELSEHVYVAGLRGGVAYVVVDSASTGYELDRRLRGGLEQVLRRRYRGTLARIRITVGDLGEKKGTKGLRD
jgi:hypothetical protein